MADNPTEFSSTIVPFVVFTLGYGSNGLRGIVSIGVSRLTTDN